MSIGLLGKKLGMTRLFDEKGRLTTATVIDASGNRLLQVKSTRKGRLSCGSGGLCGPEASARDQGAGGSLR